MSNIFETLASSTRFVRLQRNVDQETAAREAGISLRTIQNIEAGKAVNSSSLFAYLAYLNLLDNMLSTLPDPTKLTPMEQLVTTPKRRARARKSKKTGIEESVASYDKASFQWGDEK